MGTKVDRSARLSTGGPAYHEENLTLVLDHLDLGILLLNASGEITYCNTACTAITGYPKCSLSGMTIDGLLQEALLSVQDNVMPLLHLENGAVRDAQKNRQIWSGDLHLRRLDGKEYEASIKISAIWRAGKLHQYMVSMRDVTPQKEHERMRINFFYDLAHELRTPLTNLRLYHDLLARDASKSGDYLDIVAGQMDRLEALIVDLLNFVHLKHRILPTNRTPVHLNNLILKLVGEQCCYAAQKNLTVEFDLQPELLSVQADYGQMEQIICNLLINAIKYTPAGGKIRFKTSFEIIDATPHVVIEISDTGMGIPPDELKYIFDRFFRAKNARSSELPGTGLGLSIVKEIVRAHQGTIRVDSVLDQRTTFTIELPHTI
jgi:PAS domain S-box-containing protein